MPCTRNILMWRLIAKCEYGNGKSPNIYDILFCGPHWILDILSDLIGSSNFLNRFN